MTLRIREKVILISLAVILLSIGVHIFVSTMVFKKEYGKALELKTFVIAETLNTQLDRLLKLDISLHEITGFDEQCREMVSKYKEISFAMVVNTDGTILFHNDAAKHGEKAPDIVLPKTIPDEDKDTYRHTTNISMRCVSIPVLGKQRRQIGSIIVGYGNEFITEKVGEMIGYSVRIFFLIVSIAVFLLVVFLNYWVTKPLQSLISTIQDIREKGTASIKPIKLETNDEIGNLGDVFNKMMEELKTSHGKVRDQAAQLEEQVRERTAELHAANEQLQSDIAERRKAEEKLKKAYAELKFTQSQLVQSAKLASIGELASGVAHELNQPLMVIRTTAQFLNRSSDKGTLNIDRVKEHLEPIERNTQRMMNIINHLRMFSRQSQNVFAPLDINRIIEDTFLMIGEQLRLRNIQVIKNLDPERPKAFGDTNQLEQVLLNLMANAKDAIAEKADQHPKTDGFKGMLEIDTGTWETDTSFIRISIRDNGCGIPEDCVEKIFDPFFTTKEVGRGTGLGLSISYGIIKEHHGDIEIAETGSEGTVFRILLPTREHTP